MGPHTPLQLMIDRPQGQNVFQMPKATFHFSQLLVPGHRVLSRDLLFAGGHHVLTFQTFLPLQMDGMLPKHKSSFADLPSVVTIALMGPQCSLGSSADLSGVGQRACGYACL